MSPEISSRRHGRKRRSPLTKTQRHREEKTFAVGFADGPVMALISAITHPSKWRNRCRVPPDAGSVLPADADVAACHARTLIQDAGRGIRPVRNVSSKPAGSDQRSATDQTFGTGRMPRAAAIDGAYPVRLEAYHARLATRSRPQTPTLQPITPERSLKVPDGAFAPSETFSPNPRVPINGRPRIKRSGRGECPVPPRLMGHTPSGLRMPRPAAGPALQQAWGSY